jgi:hypothetical protein
LLDPADVAEFVSRKRHRDNPENGPGNVVDGKPAVPHTAYARNEGSERPDDRHEARKDDGLASVTLEEFIGDSEMLRVRPAKSPLLLRLTAEPSAHGKIDRVTCDRGNESPGRNGMTTRPVSIKMNANKST